MKKREREIVGYIAKSATALLDAPRGQEHAARYMLGVSIRQLQNWAAEQGAGSEPPQTDSGGEPGGSP